MADSLFKRSTTLILRDPLEVDAYMRAELGFETAVLAEALDRAGADSAMTTPHNAASSFGFRFWDGLIASLRDQLAPRSWRAERPGGLEVVQRPDRRLQITGSLGDDAVGDPSVDPSCRHEKGQSTDAAIACNQLTLAGVVGADSSWDPMLTWWVLYRFSGLDERKVISELSLPRVGFGGRISDWAVRLMLPEFGVGGSGPLPIDALPDAPDPVDLKVRRLGA